MTMYQILSWSLSLNSMQSWAGMHNRVCIESGEGSQGLKSTAHFLLQGQQCFKCDFSITWELAGNAVFWLHQTFRNRLWGCRSAICVCVFLKIILFIYLIYFLAVPGLCCCTQAFSSCDKQGYLLVGGRRLLIAGGFSCCRTQSLGCVDSVAVAPGLWSTSSIVVAHAALVTP